ncbi:MAG TPA: hypothetical protein VD736_06510 [Nitrososphaera sp.]|nr:hypothetical protein [Nitrososphaera sp.]
MAIEWDVLIAEMAMLGAIIYGAVYVENWVEKRKLRRKEKEDARRTVKFVTNDLKKKLHFIEDSVQYKDFKPFFTDMWDAVILGGKQSVLPFELFENLQHTYSWMKYYNNELEQREKSDGEAAIMEILNEVKGSIDQSLKLLEKSKI